LRIWFSSISPALGSQPHNSDNTGMKNIIRLFFIVTVALITVVILSSLIQG